ncbi:bacterioferritin comigratory protein (Bcp) [Psychromonas sp. CNPT3]|uniref:thioredoxin-dependent thiol peroxidase n=1 Tax=Psychromonas sp. CNPT3 TaxID=314282 RepID=UPI00006E7676|nr:thioredoxin-dependent thiol peroxidase [Psychromonas sp. CNPT3]AGH81698.1 bacterioferritin comigratory protein (Bcp) [Psychromonas sp. CNPT3]
MNRLIKGDKAPLFNLQDENDNAVSLADLKGKKVLIYFYPRAMTPGCITQACGLRDSQTQLAELNTVVYGISPDPVKKLANFVLKKELNFALLSDEDHQVAEAFGVWGEKKFMGKTYDGIHRISFLIDEKGEIEHVFDKFKTKEHHQVVLDHLNGL